MRAFPIVAVLWLTGCLSVDSAIYGAVREASYELDPRGGSSEETVTADRVEPAWIAVNDKVTLGAAYLKGSVQPPQAYVIFFHGRGGNLDTAFGRAKRWANLGYDVLVFDYRGWGASSDVTPTEEGIMEDSRAARAFLLQRIGDANASRLVYYGQSLGAAIATELAQAQPPSALVLESAFASIQAFVNDDTGMDFPADFISECHWDVAGRIRDVHVPLLLVAGTADETNRAEFSSQIYGNANEPKKLVVVEGAGHGNVPETMGPQQYRELMNGFIGGAIGP